MSDFPVHDFDPRNIPPDMLRAIGSIITCTSFAEAILDQILAGFINTDVEIGSAVTAHMSMPLKFGILRSTAEIVINNLQDLDELDGIIDELENALKQRNIYAHDQIGIARDQVFAVSTKARAGLEVGLKPLAVDKIEAEAIRIYNAGMALFTFAGMRNLFPASPPPRTPRQHKTKAARKRLRKKI